MKIEEKLFQLRKTLNLSQSEMGKDAISFGMLSRIERGIHCISADQLIDVLESNQISVVNFLKDFSTVRRSFKFYQDAVEQAYQERNVYKLKDLLNDSHLPSGIIFWVVNDMVSLLEGRKKKFQRHIYSVLKKMDSRDSLSFWTLKMYLKIYFIG